MDGGKCANLLGGLTLMQWPQTWGSTEVSPESDERHLKSSASAQSLFPQGRVNGCYMLKGLHLYKYWHLEEKELF